MSYPRIDNPNCDFSSDSGCSLNAEVRLLPLGDSPHSGNIICCRTHHAHELRYRQERNRELGASVQFALPAWETLTVYDNSGTPERATARVEE